MTSKQQRSSPAAARPAAPDLLSPKDRLVWRLDSGNRVRPNIVIVMLLDGKPTWEDFCAWHENLCTLLPRLRTRVSHGRTPWSRPAWVPDPDFHLDHHLHRTRVAGEGTLKDAVRAAEIVAEIPFQRSRSPWHGHLIEGLKEGRSAYVLTISHSIADGIRLREVFLRQERATRPPRAADRASQKTEVGTLDALSLPGATRRSVSGKSILRRAAKAAWFLGQAARDMCDLPHSVPPAGGNFARCFFTTVVPTDTLKILAAASGGSIHDALVAAVMEGCSRYNSTLGMTRRRMRVLSPYGRAPRPTPDPSPTMGNHWFLVRFGVRAAQAGPADRIRAVRSAVRKAYHRDAADWMGAVATLAPLLPQRVLEASFLRLCASHDFVVSNIPGPRETLRVAGVRSDQIFAIAPTLGAGVTVTLLSYRTHCYVTVSIDPSVITEPILLGRHIRASIQESSASGAKQIVRHPGVVP